MAIINRVNKKTTKKPAKKVDTSFEKTNEIKKLKVYVVIVDHGVGDTITYMFQKFGSAVQFISMGNGTASRQINDILGVEDNGKDIMFAIIKEEDIPAAREELETFFKSSKRHRGIGFAIPLTSIIGVKLYKFLAHTKSEEK